MTLLDFILNLAGLLIWLSWCSRRFDPLTRTAPATLAATVKRAEPPALGGWPLLAGLAALLAGRALFYYEIGSAAGWTPKLDLGVIVLAFRSDKLGPVALYSVMSFGRVLVVYYFCLLSLVLVNWSAREPDPLQKLLRLHLGRLSRWPRPVLVLLPLVGVSMLWLVLHPVLAKAGVVIPTPLIQHLLEQALLLTIVLVLSLKYLLAAILLVDLVASYVYLGASPVWDFIRATSSNILKPIERLPLRFGKADMTPVAGLLLILLLLHWLPQGLESELSRRGVVIWPQ